MNEREVRKLLDDVIAAWREGWDCSANPSHEAVEVAIRTAEHAIEEIDAASPRGHGELACRVVDRIVADLTQRRGLRHEWERIDPEIQAEIVTEWRAAVEAEAHLAVSSAVEGARKALDPCGPASEEIAELRAAVRKYHAWLETVEEQRRLQGAQILGPGQKVGYMGLDHKVGENVDGCDGCALLARESQ